LNQRRGGSKEKDNQSLRYPLEPNKRKGKK